jgi:hypothetical protein
MRLRLVTKLAEELAVGDIILADDNGGIKVGTKSVKWHIVPSMTDPEMFAVKGHYEFGDLHPEYIVADNVPIEDATLIAAAPELARSGRAAFDCERRCGGMCNTTSEGTRSPSKAVGC